MHTYIVIVNALLVFSLGITVAVDDEFRGAVVEYSPIYKNTSKETVIANAESYAAIVAKLKENYNDLKVVVFPEFGLSSVEWLTQGTKTLIHGEEIPEKNQDQSFCETNYAAGVLKSLACIAKNNSLYIQFNLVEKSKSANNSDILYDTNVVFSPKGALVAKYRKYNLYGFEHNIFTTPEKAEIVYFDTDFGVRFGTFTCADIIYKTPAQDLVNGDGKVSHVLYGSAWVSELPFFTAIQEHSAWSYGTNKVLLAAGLNNPEKYGFTGSGIYLGKLGAQDESFNKRSVQSQIKGNFAIISYIPKYLNKSQFSSRSEIYTFYDQTKPEKSLMKLNKDNLNVYTTETLKESDKFESEINSYNVTLFTQTAVNKTVCNRGFCCDFTFKMTKGYCIDIIMPSKSDAVGDEFGQYNYRLAVFNGVRKFDNFRTAGIQVCSIISCLDNDEGSCGKRTDSGSTPKVITQFSNYKYQQCYTQFEDVVIKTELNTKNSFVSSNILLSSNHYEPNPHNGLTDNFIRFGDIANPLLYTLAYDGDAVNGTTPFVFKSISDILNPASINILNRVYDLDDKQETRNPSSGSTFKVSKVLFLVPILVLFIRRH